MQDTRIMRFEALKQATLDLNMSTENILVPLTSEIISLVASDIEHAVKLSEAIGDGELD